MKAVIRNGCLLLVSAAETPDGDVIGPIPSAISEEVRQAIKGLWLRKAGEANARESNTLHLARVLRGVERASYMQRLGACSRCGQVGATVDTEDGRMLDPSGSEIRLELGNLALLRVRPGGLVCPRCQRKPRP